ncbi:hypothetical protein F5Y16DRAFT_419975 [Xylariaceae sp. FL0255]|nr:hypothetical protein F5Y16DRAFT_419975 [Xylariaceae sp. FL0255]
MEKGDAPSLAQSSNPLNADDALHSGFEQLIQHNAAVSPYHEQKPDVGSHADSNSHSRYSSPAPQQSASAGYDPQSTFNHASPYTTPGYQGEYQPGYTIDPSSYPQLPDAPSSITPHYTPEQSPPSTQVEGMTTRSGRAIMRVPGSQTLTRPARIEKSSPKPRTTRRKAKKMNDAFGDDQALQLAAPLSVLVKNITNITDTDIEAYVKRSPEERRNEVAQSKTGKVKRPMNAFMLYRKAYQNRTKEWKKHDDIRRRAERASEGKPEKGHDNHQVISQVCGISWNMEPQELRDWFDNLAKIERNNHKLAFPDYKFAPAKAKIKKPGGGNGGSSNRHGDHGDSDDNASNLDVYDIQDWGHPISGPPSRNMSRAARYGDPDGDYGIPPPYSGSLYGSPSPGPQGARLPYMTQGYPQQHQIQQHHPPHPSSFQYSNPGKPRPADYGSSLSHGQYYQQSSDFAQQAYPPQPSYHAFGGPYGLHQPMPAYVENVYVNKANSPAASSSFHGSPVLEHHHGGYNDLIRPSPAYGHAAQLQQHHLQMQPQPPPPYRPAEHQIDPSLMSSAPHDTTVGGAVGSITPDETYDSLGILGLDQSADFSVDTLQPYQPEQGGSHTASPHPQQFEQAYHTPNENDSTASLADSKEAVAAEIAGAVVSPWQDENGGDDKLTSAATAVSDWETTLGGVTADFQLEDIDQILGTTTDSPAP